MIRFLLKSVIWLSLAFLIMPRILGPQADTPTKKPAAVTTPGTPRASVESNAPANISANAQSGQISAALAAGQAAAELGSFCLKNPDLCEAGRSALSSIGSEALKGSGSVLEYLSDRFGDKISAIPVSQSNNIVTGAIANTSKLLPKQSIPVPTWRDDMLKSRP